MNHKMNGFFLFLIVQSSKARVEYVQLLVFQMNSHQIDLQLAGAADSHQRRRRAHSSEENRRLKS